MEYDLDLSKEFRWQKSALQQWQKRGTERLPAIGITSGAPVGVVWGTA